MSSAKNITEKAFALLKVLPRISHSNIQHIGKAKRRKIGRGQHGGDKIGMGNKGSLQRQNYMRLGYETGNNPFYLRFPYEPYYRGHHLKKQYPPISMQQLQMLIDTDRIDTSQPIDLSSLCNTGLLDINPADKHYGFHLTEEGVDSFKARINIEVQWTSEAVIAAIERNGGAITTAFYDIHSLWILRNPKLFFKRGEPIPRRMMPSEDVLEYYCSADNRGYLADPEKIAEGRLILSQKFGYHHIPIDPQDPLFAERKDPRQIFLGLEPGWLVNIVDKQILKPQEDNLSKFYES